MPSVLTRQNLPNNSWNNSSSTSFTGNNFLHANSSQTLGLYSLNASQFFLAKNNEHKVYRFMFLLGLFSVFLQVLPQAVLWLKRTWGAPASLGTRAHSVKGRCSPPHPSGSWPHGQAAAGPAGSPEPGLRLLVSLNWKKVSWEKHKPAFSFLLLFCACFRNLRMRQSIL